MEKKPDTTSHRPRASQRCALRTSLTLLMTVACTSLEPTSRTAESYVCSEPVPVTCAKQLELVFARMSDGQIYRARFDGSELRRLTSEGENSNPSWSPDGRRIAFLRREPGTQSRSDVWLMGADGSNPIRRTVQGNYRSVAWSPDGTRLAVSDDGVYSSSVWILTVEGDAAATLLPGQARSPAWSPDGRKIAFVRPSGDDGYDAVWVMNPDGADAKPLTTPGGGIEWGIAWSPDGRSIAYWANADVHIMDADGSGNRVVAANTGFGADWSPDGKWLAVMISAPGQWVIGYLPVDGGEPIVILRNAFGASWRP
jgi:Tol biopolymer transport system component